VDCAGRSEVLITFEVPLSQKLSLEESLALVSKQGYQRLLLNGEIVRISDWKSAIRHPPSAITIVQDRLKLASRNRARFVEACEQPIIRQGRLSVHPVRISDSTNQRFNDAASQPCAARRCGSATAFTARNATSSTASRRPRCSASIIPWAPAPPAAGSAA